MIMKKLLTGCMVALAILATLTGLAGCDQDKVLYNGRNYLMFSDTLYHYAVQESNEKLEVPVSATRRADYDRTFAVEVVDKESNAVEGKHYRLLSNTATFLKALRTTFCNTSCSQSPRTVTASSIVLVSRRSL